MKLSHKNRARHERRVAARQGKSAQENISLENAELRVIKEDDKQFRLVWADGKKILKRDSTTHAKQKLAVNDGFVRFGVWAKRLLKAA